MENQRWLIAYSADYVRGQSAAISDKDNQIRIPVDEALDNAENAFTLKVKAYWYGYYDRITTEQ